MFDAGDWQIRFSRRDYFGGRGRNDLAFSESVSLVRKASRRRIDPKRRLLLLFSDSHLCGDQHCVDDRELAHSAMRGHLGDQSAWRIPSGEIFTFGIESSQREPSGAAHFTALRMINCTSG